MSEEEWGECIESLEREGEKMSRRKYLGALGAAGATTTAGCLFGSGAPEIQDQARATNDALETQLPWGSYRLNYNVDSVNVDVERVGSTGVENAGTYRINAKVALADNSDDLDGWLSTEELTEEFFSLLNNTTYDMFTRTYDGFQDFSPPNQPSHRNQIVEYSVRVNAEDCSYIQYRAPAQRMDEVLSSRQAYSDYFSPDGENFGVVRDSGRLGLGIIC